MNIKINIRIYTSSAHQNIIPYIQGGCVSALLILVSSIEELIMRELQDRECL
jgi:hypothetical protein